MPHAVETMAWATEVPWHGLGKQVDPNSTIETMLEAAGLDWTVDLRPIFAEAKDSSMIKIPIRRALMRSSDNKVMTITSDYWKPLQNKQALEFFRDYTQAGGASLETAGSLRGGKVIWALASINKGFKVKGRDYDKVKGYVLLTTRHEVGTKHGVKTTSVRVVCANTLAMSEKGGYDYSQNHLSDFDVSKAKARIGLAVDQIAEMEKDANKLADLKMSTFDSLRLLAEFIQPAPEGVSVDAHANLLLNDPGEQSKVLQAVMLSVNKAPGADPETGWGLLNGVTHYVDHAAGNQAEARLYNSWFGDRGKLKNDVMDKLLELVS